MSCILVTGASGFIGRNVTRGLRETGHRVLEVTRASGDVADQSTWAALPKADAVVHLAGKASVPDSWAEPASCLRTNVLGTVAALEYCRARGARLVFVSSYLYGVSVNGPIPENAPVVPASPYALSKILAENVCRFYSENFGISTTILRPFNVYGPGQSAQFLIPLIIRQARSGCEIRVRDLAPKRDYVYVADVVRAIECALEGESSYGVFNIGSGVSHSVAEVISVIQDVWGTSLPVVSSEERRRNETMDTVADIAQAKACLGWSPEFSLQEGLREMCRQDAAIDPTELT